MFNIQGKTAIVTGGSSGLGYSMAQGLCEAGTRVLIIGRNESKLQRAADQLAAEGHSVESLAADLSKLDQVPEIFARCVELLGGRVDILVNNAGIQHRCKAEDFPMEMWNQIIDTNLSAVFAMAQQAGRHMIEMGGGKIINIASMTCWFGSEMIPAYSSSKGAVMQLTRALSNEWMKYGINVNAIAPGYMETELTGDMKVKNPGQYEEITGRIPAHRWGKGDDLKGIVVFLASEASGYISGAIIPVDGGYLGK